jgi:hypothetical protein
MSKNSGTIESIINLRRVIKTVFVHIERLNKRKKA